MSQITIKKKVILRLYDFLTTEVLANNNLILITAAGIISGKPIVEDDVSKVENKTFSNGKLNPETAVAISTNLVKMISEEFDKENMPDSPISGNDGYITLKDVVILSSGVKSSLPALTIFIDQIIGVSFGNLNP